MKKLIFFLIVFFTVENLIIALYILIYGQFSEFPESNENLLPALWEIFYNIYLIRLIIAFPIYALAFIFTFISGNIESITRIMAYVILGYTLLHCAIFMDYVADGFYQLFILGFISWLLFYLMKRFIFYKKTIEIK